MLIEVEQEIVEKALKESNILQPYSSLLCELALCVKKGISVVVVPCLKRKKEFLLKLKKCIGEPYSNLLAYTSNKGAAYAKTIYANICTCMVVSITNKGVKEIDGIRKIFVNVQGGYSFNFSDETRILAENQTDIDFYKYTINYYKRINENIRECDCQFYPISGGGSTIDTCLNTEILIGQHTCLAIADSDKKYPSDSIGNTAQNLLKLYRQNLKKDTCFTYVYVNENYMEIENLIPHKYIVSKLKNKKDIDWDKYDLSFYDLKDGLTADDLTDNNAKLYWESVFGEYDICGNVPMPGLSSKLLKNVTDQKVILNNVVTDDLNKVQKSAWEELGKIIFSWTCAMKAKQL